MEPHLDHHRLVFWVEGEETYHELIDGQGSGDGIERGRCGRVTRSQGHECTALVAESMALRPCPECQRARVRGAPAGTTTPPDVGAEPVRGVIFDTDGVVTRTATVHEAAWRELFDGYLRTRADRHAEDFVAFTSDDYRRYVDGKPRYDGVASFLASRGIELERGSPDDPPDRDTVSGLGNRKNRALLDALHRSGADPYESTLTLVRRIRELGVAVAVVSASENCAEVLESAGATELFDVRVDGVDATRMDLAGKPDPALFLEAARRLGEDPSGCTVVEDALAGVEAGRRGGFGVVIGVDRTGHPDALADHGADVVVPDLSWVELDDERRWRIARSPGDEEAGRRG